MSKVILIGGLLAILAVVLLGAFAMRGEAEPAYTPSPATLAQREQAAYDEAVRRGQTAWVIGLVWMCLFLGILLVLSGFLSRVGYRVQAAKAAMREAEARRARLVDLGNGAVLELLGDGSDGQSVIHRVPYEAAPQIQRAEPVQPAPQRQERNPQQFVLEAAAIVGWDSEIIPRWSRWAEKGYQMTGAEWMRTTDELVGAGLVEKKPGAETIVIDGCLRDLYHDLAASPTGG